MDEVSHLDNHEFLYTDLDKLGVIEELRWDPGEVGGIVVRDIHIKDCFKTTTLRNIC